MFPLSYVIHPDLKIDEPFSEQWGLIEMDLIVRVSYTHVLFAHSAKAVYFKLEEACRGSKYTDSLKPFL